MSMFSINLAALTLRDWSHNALATQPKALLLFSVFVIVNKKEELSI